MIVFAPCAYSSQTVFTSGLTRPARNSDMTPSWTASPCQVAGPTNSSACVAPAFAARICTAFPRAAFAPPPKAPIGSLAPITVAVVGDKARRQLRDRYGDGEDVVVERGGGRLPRFKKRPG